MYIPILSEVIKGGVELLKGRSERKQSATTQRNELIKAKDSHNHTWEIAALEGEGYELPLIRMVAFLEVTIGTAITVMDPDLGAAIWASLALVPTWVIGLKVTVFGWAFGSTPIKNVAAGLVGSVVKFPKDK